MEAPASSSSGLSFLLHPLILLNVSDHHTRTVAMTGSRDQRVRGILLGSQAGRTIEIVNSFEMKVEAQGIVDHAFLQLKLHQCEPAMYCHANPIYLIAMCACRQAGVSPPGPRWMVSSSSSPLALAPYVPAYSYRSSSISQVLYWTLNRRP